jgi:hypothetical protein
MENQKLLQIEKNLHEEEDGINKEDLDTLYRLKEMIENYIIELV